MPGLDLSERDWQSTVTGLATVMGWWTHHHHDSRRSSEGWPDLVLLRPPDALFVELKTNTGRVRPEQALVLQMLSECGLEVHVWRPRDWEIVRSRLIRKPGKENDV